MPAFKILATVAMAAAVTGAPAFAQMGGSAMSSMSPMSPKAFVMKAGASDKFEITEGQLMQKSKNPQVAQFAQKMITDHTQSTSQITAAATQDGLKPMPPMLEAKQQVMLTKLKATPAGALRDKLYIQQQKMAHQEALALMQSEASSGTTPALKQAAAQVEPVVQSHVDMLNQMSAM